MSVVITTPVPSPHIPGINNAGIVLPATTTVEVDSIPLAEFIAAKWLVTLQDTVNDRTRMFEVSAVYRPTKPPLHTVFGDVGDRIKVQVQTDVTPTDFTLSIINNDTVDVITSVMRIQIT